MRVDLGTHKGYTRSMDAVRIYLESIRQIPTLTRAEELELGRRIQKGRPKRDPECVTRNPTKGMTKDAVEACHKLVYHNLRFVPWALAGHINETNRVALDLFQEGTFGLYAAARKYDPNRNIRFTTYAMPWVRQFAMRCGNANVSVIHVPPCARTGPHKKKADQALARMVSLSEPRKGNDEGAGDSPLWEVPIEYDFVEDVSTQELRQRIKECLYILSPRESYIIIRRFGLDGRKTLTLEELGKTYKITKERVRQIETGALALLKQALLAA